MQDDQDFYESALGITRSISTAKTLRQWMDDIGSNIQSKKLEANIDMFLNRGVEPTAFETGEIPMDFDVTCFDNSRTQNDSASKHKRLRQICTKYDLY